MNTPQPSAFPDSESLAAATSYNNRGYACFCRGNCTEALDYYFKALAIREKELGENHPDTALSYSYIGSLYEAQGDYSRALEYLRKALAVYKHKYGSENDYTQAVEQEIATIDSIVSER